MADVWRKRDYYSVRGIAAAVLDERCGF